MERKNSVHIHYNFNYSTADDLLVALDPRDKEFDEDGWAFRGQADSKWRLVASALRSNALVKLSGLEDINTEDKDLRTQLLNEY